MRILTNCLAENVISCLDMLSDSYSYLPLTVLTLLKTRDSNCLPDKLKGKHVLSVPPRQLKICFMINARAALTLKLFYPTGYVSEKRME